MKKMNRITALVVAGIISCTSPMMVMASDSSSVMSQAEEILKDISKFRGIDISDDQIKGYVSDAYSTLKDMGVTKSDVKNIFEKAIEFIKGMLSRQ